MLEEILDAVRSIQRATQPAPVESVWTWQAPGSGKSAAIADWLKTIEEKPKQPEKRPTSLQKLLDIIKANEAASSEPPKQSENPE